MFKSDRNSNTDTMFVGLSCAAQSGETNEMVPASLGITASVGHNGDNKFPFNITKEEGPFH